MLSKASGAITAIFYLLGAGEQLGFAKGRPDLSSAVRAAGGFG